VAVAASAAFVALLAYGLLAKAPDTTIDTALAQGEAPEAPAFALEVLQPGSVPDELRPVRTAAADDQLRLDELRGFPVVLNFWASWCDPCGEEAPVLEAGWRRYQDQAVFIGLDMQDVRTDATDFLDRYGISYPNVKDPADDVAGDYGASGIPETFFIDEDGRVVAHAIGVLDEKLLEAGVQAAVRGEVLGNFNGGAVRSTR
jgi:cytochrome c biogenesis protein CcmG/thiol:disulfide interchange protein DsbE